MLLCSGIGSFLPKSLCGQFIKKSNQLEKNGFILYYITAFYSDIANCDRALPVITLILQTGNKLKQS